MIETTFEVYGEGGGYEDLSLEEALRLLITFREQGLEAGDETDLSIQEVRWGDDGMPVAHRQMEIEPSWRDEPEAVLDCLRERRFTWSRWQQL